MATAQNHERGWSTFASPGKDPDSKLEVQFLQNGCRFHAVIKSKKSTRSWEPSVDPEQVNLLEVVDLFITFFGVIMPRCVCLCPNSNCTYQICMTFFYIKSPSVKLKNKLLCPCENSFYGPPTSMCPSKGARERPQNCPAQATWLVVLGHLGAGREGPGTSSLPPSPTGVLQCREQRCNLS